MSIVVGDDEVPLPVAVEHYWTYKRLAASAVRADRLAAGDHFPFVEVFGDLAAMDPVTAAAAVDALLDHPDADPSLVGAGPLEDWLNESGSEVDPTVLQRYRSDARWRDALTSVYPGDEVLSGHRDLTRLVWPDLTGKAR